MTRSRTELRGASYAKLNLFLRILNRRPDGYHEIETIIQTISLHDLLTFRPADSGIEISVTGPAREGVPEGDANLCHIAAACLFDQLDLKRGITINLKKVVPAGAGLGGGSSNAAGTLLALNQLYSLDLPVPELCEIGAKVGSDVPPLLVGGTVLATGRGEKVEKLEGVPPLHFLVLKPDFGCSTRAIYEAWDEVGEVGGVELDAVLEALRSADLDTLSQMPLNDLELTAFSLYPQLADLKKELADAGAEFSLLCGSGSAVAGIFSSLEQRDAAWLQLSQSGLQAFHSDSVPSGTSFGPERNVDS